MYIIVYIDITSFYVSTVLLLLLTIFFSTVKSLNIYIFLHFYLLTSYIYLSPYIYISLYLYLLLITAPRAGIPN